jgi:hypothetical protein
MERKRFFTVKSLRRSSARKRRDDGGKANGVSRALASACGAVADERLQSDNNALTTSTPAINFAIATVDAWSTTARNKAIVALQRRVDR